MDDEVQAMKAGAVVGWPAWAYALLGFACLLLFVEALTEAAAFGRGESQAELGDVLYLVVSIGAAAAASAAAWVRRDAAGWGMIALALCLNAAGEVTYQFAVDPIEGSYPSPADYLYFSFYVFALIGLRNIGRRGDRPAMPVIALLTPLLGLAALWSAVVFDPVLGTLEGTTAAKMTTVAYPCLDLLVVCAALFTLAANGWRLGPSLLVLIAGIVPIAVADSVYAAQVASGAVADQAIVDVLWPTGVLIMAVAAWIGERQARDQAISPLTVELCFALPALGMAAGILILDHFDRLHDVTVALAGLTLVSAAVRLFTLYREAEKAKLSALEATRERGRIEKLHSASMEAALQAIITADAEGRVVSWNPAARRIFGYEEEEACGRTIAELVVSPDRRRRHLEGFARFASGEGEEMAGRRFETMGMRSDGTEIPIELSVARVSEDPPLFTAFAADISERKHREAERERLAEMVRSAEDAMYSTNRDLKVIAWNPAAERLYGYGPDEIVGETLDRIVPADKRDEMSRLREVVAGGETVAVETKRVRKDGEVIDIALQIHPVRDEIGRITGFSSVARDITDRRRREREQRLHRERAAWRSQIEEALDHDGFEFHRQPILDLRTGRIAHHELLLRMRLDGELIPPARFLPYAESSSSLIRRIDRWAIRHGIELAAERPVAINLSARSLSDTGIAKAVQAALERSGAEPRHITFEITETAAAERLEDAHALVSALRGLGCGVALDDFGTGYGSFTYLLRMPVTSLKIDMEFIRALSEDPADQRVVGSILAVAQNFGLTTVAEGVENETTLDLLRQMGVDGVQGYLIGRPGPDWTSEAELSRTLAAAEAP